MQSYNLELDKAVAAVKSANAKTVCIQLPDGLKPEAGKISDEITQKTGARVIIWLSTCFGACDVPPVEKLGVDLLIQWGHSEFR